MSFQDLNIIAPLQRSLDEEGYTTPTPIQTLAIPHLLKGEDMIGIAQTGTGKTAAFVLPILQRMSEEDRAPIHGVRDPRVPRALVVAPTRELAAQIAESFATYGRHLKFRQTAIFGGINQRGQVKALTRGVDILVATPGRLMDLMNQGYVNLKGVQFFVLDEIDRMLDMGFINDVRKIVSALPQKRQSLFFSATMSRQTEELARRFLKDPIRVEAAPQASTLDTTKQRVFFVDQNSKNSLLLSLLKEQDLKRVLIFTRTKHRADKVREALLKNNITADAIHGNKSQGQRINSLNNFKSGRLQALVATDIAARGIDINDISHVINYDLPNEPEVYVHRIGRTGRAGAKGTAYSFSAADERSFLSGIERLTGEKIGVMQHPYHSERAKNAVGAEARPAPRKSSGQPRSFRQESGHESGRRPSPNKPATRRPYPARR